MPEGFRRGPSRSPKARKSARNRPTRGRMQRNNSLRHRFSRRSRRRRPRPRRRPGRRSGHIRRHPPLRREEASDSPARIRTNSLRRASMQARPGKSNSGFGSFLVGICVLPPGNGFVGMANVPINRQPPQEARKNQTHQKCNKMDYNYLQINRGCFIKLRRGSVTPEKSSKTFFEPEFYYLV